MGDINLFNEESPGFFCQGFDNISVIKIRVDPKVTKAHSVNPLEKLVLYIKIVGEIFVFVKNCLVLYLAKVALRPIGLIPCQFPNRVISRFLKSFVS